MATFVPGRTLAADLYREALAPALVGVPHAAGLLGPGSEVAGFDTVRSTDHDWGPRAQVFVRPDRLAQARALVERAVPSHVRGWPTAFARRGSAASHHVEVVTTHAWLRDRLGFAPDGPPTLEDWLSTPQQLLAEVTAAR